MAIVASTCPLCTAAIMFGTCCTGRSSTVLRSKCSHLGDAADHVVEGRAILGDGEAVARQFVRRRQAGVEGLVRNQDGGAFVAVFLMHRAADHLQHALLCQVEEAAGQRGDADIDVAGHGRRGDRLRGFEEAEREVDALVAEIAAFLRDVERRGRQRMQQAQAERFGGAGTRQALMPRGKQAEAGAPAERNSRYHVTLPAVRRPGYAPIGGLRPAAPGSGA